MGLLTMIASTIILIILGIIYFAITLLVIKVASDWIFGTGLDQNWAVLAAAIVTLGSMLGGSVGKKVTIFTKE